MLVCFMVMLMGFRVIYIGVKGMGVAEMELVNNSIINADLVWISINILESILKTVFKDIGQQDWLNFHNTNKTKAHKI